MSRIEQADSLREALPDEVIERAARAVADCEGRSSTDKPEVIALAVIDAIDPAVDAMLSAERERIAQAIEAMRPHIPPNWNQTRRERIVQRSTLNSAARTIRAGGEAE